MATRPKNIELRTYQVGFGDCFLLTFKYAARDRHVLIDFGSMALPEGAAKGHMLKVAEQIRKDCGGQLDIVVATHRHTDHVSGFATNKAGKAPGNIIASCKPRMVVQPWTEDPRAAKNAKKAKNSAPVDIQALMAFTTSLDRMHGVASAAVDTARVLRRGVSNGDTLRQLTYLGQDNIKNRSAVENLMKMGPNHYVQCDDKLPVARLLPGVKVHILGPPSLEQDDRVDGITKQRAKDAAEFWHLQAAAGGLGVGNGRTLFPRFRSPSTPIDARWFAFRMRNLRADTMLSIVRVLDKQMNNTSLILLFEVGDKLLLFPGDAQIENWLFALKQKKFVNLLRRVNLYKVGHHGSLNATPKSLWKLFDHKGPARKPGRLKSVLSTLADVHGHEDSGTEVPRSKLVNALKDNSDLLTTESYKASEVSRVIPL